MEKALFKAVQRNKINIISPILYQGANVNAINDDGDTLLHVAVVKANFEIVKILIDFGADVNVKNRKNKTPIELSLMFTSRNESRICKIIKLLIQSGADVNTREDDYGLSVLHIVTLIQDLELLQLVISKGADLNYADKITNHTALHYVAMAVGTYFDNKLLSVIETLLSAKADVNARDNNNATPLQAFIYMLISSVPLPEEQKSVIFKVIEIFSKHGADFHARDNNKMSPILLAKKSCNRNLQEAIRRFSGIHV